jgi:hypothetical protein
VETIINDGQKNSTNNYRRQKNIVKIYRRSYKPVSGYKIIFWGPMCGHLKNHRRSVSSEICYKRICVATNLQIILKHTILSAVNSTRPIDFCRMIWLIFGALLYLQPTCLLFIPDLTHGVASQSALFSINLLILSRV